MLPTLLRALAAPVVACLLVASCSSEDGGGSDGGSTSSGGDTRSVTVDGLTFDVPSGYSEVDADDVAKGGEDNDQLGELADRMGVSTDQFLQAMRSVDLFLFSDEGPANGFLDNVNVLDQPGAVPTEDQLQQQFQQLGADVEDVQHASTDAGEVAVVDYSLTVGESEVAGRGIFVEHDPGLVSITVSTSDPDTTDELGDRIVDTLAEAS